MRDEQPITHRALHSVSEYDLGAPLAEHVTALVLHWDDRFAMAVATLAVFVCWNGLVAQEIAPAVIELEQLSEDERDFNEHVDAGLEH